MIRLFAALMAFFAAMPVAADPSELRALMTANDSKGWEAVGRLNIAGEAFCTGALISETLVLTAAHCVYNADTGERYPANSIEFLAGWRNGRAVAYRSVRRYVVNEAYDFAGEDTSRSKKPTWPPLPWATGRARAMRSVSCLTPSTGPRPRRYRRRARCWVVRVDRW